MRKIWLLLPIVIAVALVLVNGNLLTFKQKSGLQVTTNDIPATLFLDDQYLDKTPFIDKKIQPKNYTLRIQPDDTNFATYEIPITLNKGMVSVVNWKPGSTLATSGGVIYEMEKLNNNDTQIEMKTIPDGAIITFDQGIKQFSPILMTSVAEGLHEFEVSLPSFETQQHTVNVFKGHRIIITVILSKISEPSLDTITTTPAATTSATDIETANSTTQIIGPRVQILSTNFFVNNEEVLRVRDSASQAGKELGFAKVGSYYSYLNEKVDWLQIDFEGQPGWVSAQYSQKIATDSTQAN